MTFQAIIPTGGYSGWRFLNRTLESQIARFESTALNRRDEEYFRENISSALTAEDLVSDRRLLKVALGAYGLDDDINSKFFIRKVLESSSLDNTSLASKLADKSYADLAEGFGYGDYSTPNTALSTFADDILAAYRERQFEAAVGEVDNDLRLALNARRELADLASGSSSEDTKWYKVMGSEPLSEIFRTAFGLPDSFGTVDLDVQLRTLKKRAQSLLGSSSVDQFADPAKVEELTKMFMLRSESTTSISQTAKGASALSILQSGSSSGNSILQILLG